MTMKRSMIILSVLALASVAALTAPAPAQELGERWLHIRVDDAEGKGEKVRVNLPLSLAEKVLPAIKTAELREGRLRVGHHGVREVDFRAIVEALKTTRDGEFLTVESEEENIRVAKQGGYLIAQVRGADQNVDVKVPMRVVEALLDTDDPHELNLTAAVRALAEHGDIIMVDVREKKETVRVWVDSRSRQE